jgi:iron(III) transport system substrate-binding protein
MSKRILILFLLVLFAGCNKSDTANSKRELVIYAGRSKELIDGIIERFKHESGIDVQVKYGKTAELALALMEEGANSPADVFWAQDAGALGAVSQAGLFADIPDNVRTQVAEVFRNSHKHWIALTGRARTLAYSPSRVKEEDLPKSIFDLTNPKWKGKVAWSPENASFQSVVTAMRKTQGDAKTLAWLVAMKANEPKSYANNASIIEAIAAGEADLGLPNHYYLFGFKDKDPNYPVAQTYFADGDAGNLVNVSGAGILKTTKHSAEAIEFLNFVLSKAGQIYMANNEFEYPVISNVPLHKDLTSFDVLQKSRVQVDLNTLADLQGTLDMLRQVGLL